MAHLCRLLIPHGPPYYGMGYMLYQLLGGCAPWPGEKGWVLICSMSICVGYGLRRHPCCPQLGCGSGLSSDEGGRSPAAGATAEEVILPFRGGGLWRINTFWRLPRPLCWVPVRGPSECYLAACHCVRRPVLGGLDFFTARKGDVFLEYSWASACVCPPEGGPEVLVVHNGHCVA
jgi:hypothetical protein